MISNSPARPAQPNTPPVPEAPDAYQLPGINVLLIGDGGTGKTHSIRTLVEAGLEVFVIFTEPGMEVLADVPADRLHWKYVKPASPSFSDMIDSADKINRMTMKMLSDLPGIHKEKYTNYIDILRACDNFICDRTGECFGSVEHWGNDRAIVLDSLSGASIAAINLGTGSKPVKSQADWGIAMDNLERLIIKLCVDTEATFVLTAHQEREVDEVLGGTTITVSTLGRKLAPKVPRFFSDVINTKRTLDKFSWSTATNNMALKARNLKWAESLPPSFVPLVSNWRRAHGLAAPALPPATSR